MQNSDLRFIASQFQFPGSVVSVKPYGSGLINDTYRVSFEHNEQINSARIHPRIGHRAILQRINAAVFPDPVKVMQNLEIVLAGARAPDEVEETESFLLPPLYYTHQGQSYYQEHNGGVWRALAYIENTCSFDQLQDLAQAHETGVALGAFHRRLNSLPVQKLHDTLPGFHITPDYLRLFDEVVADAAKPVEHGEDWQFCHDTIQANRDLAGSLVNRNPPLTLRVMHGDPKLNNILFDRQTGKAVSIIDLDTVKPGLVQFDIADCLRSCCNRGGELPEHMHAIKFDLDVCHSILAGYMATMGDTLEARDTDCLFEAIQLLPFELGLRFFTDFIQGNRYFKVNSATDNLYRAMTQFLLLRSIQQQQRPIRALIEDFGRFGEKSAPPTGMEH